MLSFYTLYTFSYQACWWIHVETSSSPCYLLLNIFMLLIFGSSLIPIKYLYKFEKNEESHSKYYCTLLKDAHSI